MEQRISLITLGVTDLARAAAFYDALGWQRASNSAGVVAYDLIGQTLALYPFESLARDMGLPVEALGVGGATYAHNLSDRDALTGLMAQAEAAGARVLRPVQDTYWGGAAGYFADPDGHIWEIAWNPGSSLGPDGAFRWTGY